MLLQLKYKISDALYRGMNLRRLLLAARLDRETFANIVYRDVGRFTPEQAAALRRELIEWEKEMKTINNQQHGKRTES